VMTMGNFQLSKQVDPNNIFLVKFSELEGRFDPNTYHPIRCDAISKIMNSKFNYQRLGDLSNFSKTIIKHIDNDIYIGLENIESNTGVFLKSKEKENISSAVVFKKRQVLFPKLRPYLNKVHYANFNGVCSTEFHVLDSKCLDNKFLAYFLSLDIVVRQTTLLMSGNTLPRLQTEDIKNLLVVTPPKNIQVSIVKKMDKAYQNKKDREAQAQNLLNSIDDYLLDELGIEPPKEIDNSLKARIFTKKLSEVASGRFDAEYYQKKYINFENALINKGEYVLLKKILQILESGSRPTGGVGNIESGVLSFGGTHVSSDGYIDTSKAKYIPIEYHQKNLATATKIDDLLLVKDGATTGKIAIIQKAEHENQNINEHVFLMRLKDSVNPIYLLSYLKSSFGNMQIKREITGATVTGLTKDVVNTLKIPLPPLEKQNQIAKHIGNIRKQAKQLQTEAKTGLEQAKQEIETMILREKL